MRYRYFRNPRTTQERKAYFDVVQQEEEYGFKIKYRRSRNNVNLPSAWDDIHRSDVKQRTWKQSRKTRWKES